MIRGFVRKLLMGISSITNPFHVPKLVFPLNLSFSILNRGGHLFLRYEPDFFFKVLYYTWGTIYQVGIDEMQKKPIKVPPYLKLKIKDFK